MAGVSYNTVSSEDTEGDLGRTDLQEDLEFHASDFNTPAATSKVLPGSSGTYAGVPTVVDPSSKRFLWSLAFYAQFFNVDTSDVLQRCWAALFPRSAFLDILDGNADLYGPFWIATTVVFILFVTGTTSQYLAENHDVHFEYNFALLTGAAGLVYGYTLFVPVGLWACLKWFSLEGLGLIEAWTLYGYANIIWLPVALISWSPITILNYVFVACGLACSLFFLLRNLWPVVSATDAQVSKLILIAVIVLHSGLAIAIKVLFFAHGSPAHKAKTPSSNTPLPPSTGEQPDQPSRLFHL